MISFFKQRGINECNKHLYEIFLWDFYALVYKYCFRGKKTFHMFWNLLVCIPCIWVIRDLRIDNADCEGKAITSGESQKVNWPTHDWWETSWHSTFRYEWSSFRAAGSMSFLFSFLCCVNAKSAILFLRNLNYFFLFVIRDISFWRNIEETEASWQRCEYSEICFWNLV